MAKRRDLLEAMATSEEVAKAAGLATEIRAGENRLRMGELMQLTLSEKQLIEMGRQLDPTKRHYITIEYRGNQPWKFREKVSETALSLEPEMKKVERNTKK